MRHVLRPVPLLLALSLLLNLAAAAVLVAVAVSDRAAEEVASVAGFASTDDVDNRLDELAAEQEKTAAAVGDIDPRGTVAEWIQGLGRRVGDVEAAVGSDELADDVADLANQLDDYEFQLDEIEAMSADAESQLDGFCSWVNSAVIESIGTDLYFTYSDLQRRAC